MRCVPAQIDLPVRQTLFLDRGIHSADVLGCYYIQRADCTQTILGKVRVPIKEGRKLVELSHCHLVIQLLRVATLDSGHLALSQFSFDAHDGGSFGGSLLRLVTEEFEDFLNVGHVCLAQLLRLGIFFHVVVAVGEAESALIGFGDLLRGILEVLSGSEGEQRTAAKDRGRELAGGEVLRDGLLRLELRDTFQFGSERRGSELVNGSFIHAGRVIVADLLRYRVLGSVGPCSFFEDGAQLREIFVLQLTVGAPVRLVGWDRVVLHPAAAGVCVEINAGINGFIHGGKIEHGLGGWRSILRREWKKESKGQGSYQERDVFQKHAYLKRNRRSQTLTSRPKIYIPRSSHRRS